MSKSVNETIELNKKQKEFYNTTEEKERNNLPTRIWFSIRNGIMTKYRKSFNITDRVYAVHKEWLGDLKDKKILDLGCFNGNVLSLYLAENAKEYIGIDLSDVAIAELSRKIEEHHCPNAKALSVDFLSSEFPDKDFDIIYAYGVLHHFENLDILISKLNEKLKKGGIIISYDPLETSRPIKLVRSLYRPFQSDKEWEWPFTAKTLKKFDDSFNIIEKKGILGKSKYGILLNYLPLNKHYKRRKISNLIDSDWNSKSWSDIHHCMHLTMIMQKRD